MLRILRDICITSFTGLGTCGRGHGDMSLASAETDRTVITDRDAHASTVQGERIESEHLPGRRRTDPGSKVEDLARCHRGHHLRLSHADAARYTTAALGKTGGAEARVVEERGAPGARDRPTPPGKPEWPYSPSRTVVSADDVRHAGRYADARDQRGDCVEARFVAQQATMSMSCTSELRSLACSTRRSTPA
jgi:hypothetical protein